MRCAACDKDFHNQGTLWAHERECFARDYVWYWKARLVKDGPFIPARTWFGPPVWEAEVQDRSYSWQCLVRAETSSRAVLHGDNVPAEVDGVMLRNLAQIDKAEYDFMVAHADYATKHAPQMPDAKPTTAVDWNKREPVFGRKA